MAKTEGLVPAFFCVPDITGFTRFMATADIHFAKEVIPAMLRRIISANIIRLQIAEIEGDAVFFYKTGRLPSVRRVAKQCKLFYKTFSDFLKELKVSDPENYQKHLADNQLGLKIIIHYGHVSAANIKGRTKLLGEDVIIAHKLLKNNVDEYNYILMTHAYLGKIQGKRSIKYWFNWDQLHESKEEYEHLGEVKFCYITLNEMTDVDDLDLIDEIRNRKKIA